MWLEIAGIVIGCIAVILILSTSSIAAMLHGVVFSRQDKNPKFKYFTADDFDLSCEDLPVYYRGINLYAKIYSVKPVESCGKVVIFSHGFGAGTSSYMTEIAHFAELGYAVAAADAYGCNNSAGKKVFGFYAGAEAVIATYIALSEDERFKGKKVALVGHSWGAYSVLCASREIDVSGVVALSAFNAPAQCVADNLRSISRLGKVYAPFLQPWFYLINLFRFGVKGNTHAAKAAEKSGVKTLLIHGALDKAVPYKHSAAAKAKGANTEKLVLEDKKHNPYNTVAAEGKLAELTKCGPFDSEEAADAYFASFDWKAATEEDGKVMQKIDAFIESV